MRRIGLVLAVVGVLGLAGCGSEEPTQSPAAPAAPAETTAAVDEGEGGPVESPAAGPVAGPYADPAAMLAKVKSVELTECTEASYDMYSANTIQCVTPKSEVVYLGTCDEQQICESRGAAVQSMGSQVFTGEGWQVQTVRMETMQAIVGDMEG